MEVRMKMNIEHNESVIASATVKRSGTQNKSGWLYDLRRNTNLYLMVLPGLIGFIVFHYIPMYGIIIAFKQYDLVLGFMESPWVGFKHFQSFLTILMRSGSLKIRCC